MAGKTFMWNWNSTQKKGYKVKPCGQHRSHNLSIYLLVPVHVADPYLVKPVGIFSWPWPFLRSLKVMCTIFLILFFLSSRRIKHNWRRNNNWEERAPSLKTKERWLNYSILQNDNFFLRIFWQKLGSICHTSIVNSDISKKTHWQIY